VGSDLTLNLPLIRRAPGALQISQLEPAAAPSGLNGCSISDFLAIHCTVQTSRGTIVQSHASASALLQSNHPRLQSRMGTWIAREHLRLEVF
jgi:hypothetical protein